MNKPDLKCFVSDRGHPGPEGTSSEAINELKQIVHKPVVMYRYLCFENASGQINSP